MKDRVRSASFLSGCTRLGWLAAIWGMAGVGSGCSFAFSHRSQEYTVDTDVGLRTTYDCPGYVPPVLDTIWAGLNTIGAFQALSTDARDWDKQERMASRGTTMAIGFGWLALSGASAIYGFLQAAECKEERERENRSEERWLHGSAGKSRGYIPTPTHPVKSTYEAPPPPSENE